MKNKITATRTEKFELELRQSLSPLFSLAKIYVMHTGKNVNGSIISKEAVERNIESIKNIPIVGEYVREDKNFKGHGGELTIEDNDIVYLNTTVPIGVIPQNAETYWEIVTDDYGEEQEYLVVDNALIWNRDEKMVGALKNDKFGQSMEITITNGLELADGYYDIQDFYFTAFCVLGIDRDGAGYVQPAFDNASITTYSRTDDVEFSIGLRDMFKDFKLAFSHNENLVEEDGDLNLEELLKKYSLTEEELSAKVENYSELELTELENKLEELFSNEEVEEVEVEVEVVPETETETETEPKTEQVEEEVVEEEVLEQDEQKESTETTESAENETDEADDNVSEYEAKIALLEEENAVLKSKVESLESEVVSYEKAEHERKCNDVIKEFMVGYSIDEEVLASVDVHEFNSTAELESKLFEIVGRLAKKDFSKNKDSEPAKLKDLVAGKEKNKTSFGFESLFSKNK